MRTVTVDLDVDVQKSRIRIEDSFQGSGFTN